MSDFFDLQKPFYRPLWIRLVIVILCLGWALLEALTGGPLWAILFGAIGLYAGHQFFVVFDPEPTGTDAGDDADGSS